MRLAYLFLIVLPFMLGAQQGTPSFVTDSLEAYVLRALEEWRIPGCAVAIIKDDSLILARGFGFRDLESKQPVDEHTLFMIASNTKAVTGISLAKLELEKELSLDDKVTKWLHNFSLNDPAATSLATVRDMVTHRIGFETFQGDFCHWGTKTSRKDVIKRMSLIKPVYGFRDRYGYCNAGYTVAGEIIQKASGQKWEDYVTSHFFTPLGMTETLPLSRNFAQVENRCTPYTIYKGELIPLAIPNVDNLAPAASICSSVSDWSKWVRLILNEGKWEGRELIPPAAIQRSFEPLTPMGNFKPRFNRGNFSLYGLGWQIQDYENKKIVSHTGGADGFVTSVTLVPEVELGILVFTNTDANGFFEALKWELLDAYLSLPYRNYSALYLDRNQKHQVKASEWLQAVQDSASQRIPTDLPLKEFTGVYENEVYGQIRLSLEGQRLKASFQHHYKQTATLEHMGGNRFLCTYSNPTLGIKVIPFTVDPKKKSFAFQLYCADFVEFTSYSFRKK